MCNLFNLSPTIHDATCCMKTQHNIVAPCILSFSMQQVCIVYGGLYVYMLCQFCQMLILQNQHGFNLFGFNLLIL